MSRFLPFLALLVYMVSCSEKSEKKEDDQVQVKSVNTVADPKKQKLDALRNTAPLDLEVMKALLPEELNGIKRSHFSISSTLGYGMAHADYEKNSKTDIRITYYDCAGQAGSGIFESYYMSRLQQDKEDEKVSIKTIDLMGGKAIKKDEKDLNTITLTFLANGQVLTVISARNIEFDKLIEITKSLHLKIS